MRRYGALALSVGDVVINLDPNWAPPIEVVQEPVGESANVTVTGESPKPSRLNPLLHNKALGLDLGS